MNFTVGIHLSDKAKITANSSGNYIWLKMGDHISDAVIHIDNMKQWERLAEALEKAGELLQERDDGSVRADRPGGSESEE